MAATIDLGIPGIGPATMLNRGGSAFVYLAEQEDFGRMVAVKVLFEAVEDESTYKRFDRECRAIGAVSHHPNIVVVHGRGLTAQDRPYLVMEHRAGGSLAGLLTVRGRLTEAETIGIGIRIGSALQVAHEAGVLHRDVKPANILLSSFGEPALADFGIARMDGTHRTTDGVFSASVVHASREILDSGGPTPRSDVYALASTMFELITGVPAYASPDDRSVWAVVNRVLTEDPPDPVAAGVSEQLAPILVKAMSHDPDHRHNSAQAFVDALRPLSRPVTNDVVAMNAPTLPGPTVTRATGTGQPEADRPRTGPAQAGCGPVGAGRGRRAIREEPEEQRALSRSAMLAAVAVISIGSVAIGIMTLLGNHPDGQDRSEDVKVATLSGRPGESATAAPGAPGAPDTSPPLRATTKPAANSSAGGDLEPAGLNDDGFLSTTNGIPAGTGEPAGSDVDPAPVLLFPRAEIGPLQAGERYVLAVTGVTGSARYRIIVDGRPVTTREQTTPVYFPKPGRHQLQVEVATDTRVELTEPVAIYVADRPPRSGVRVNLSAIRSRPENWPDALRQFDRFVLDGHDGLRLSVSERNEGSALPFWNYYIPYGDDRDGAQAYCEDRGLSNQDCYVAEVSAE